MSFEWRYSAVTPDITEHKIKLTLQNSIFHIPFNRKPFAGTYIFECDVFTVEKKVVDISFSFFPLRIGGNFIFECRKIGILRHDVFVTNKVSILLLTYALQDTLLI